MNFNDFKAQVLALPIIPAESVTEHFRKDCVQSVRNQLGRWCKRGLLVQLKRGLYILSKNDRKINPGKFYIANQMLVPSYVSMESALAHYGLIPEAVHDVTSISSVKTSRFTNSMGKFIYQHEKPSAFRGYTAVRDEAGLDVFIARPEKAVVDFLYLNLKKLKNCTPDTFRNSMRFQNTERLSTIKLLKWAAVFSDARLNKAVKTFCLFLNEERKR